MKPASNLRGKEAPGLGMLAQEALAWETERTKRHISGSGTKGPCSPEAARSPGRCSSGIGELSVMAPLGKHSSKFFPCLSAGPAPTQGWPQRSQLPAPRASCRSSPGILPTAT